MIRIALVVFLISSHSLAASGSIGKSKQQAANPKTLPCDDTKTQTVRVALGRLTILSFPVTPKDILPGENSFDFRQIKNDLAIKSLRPGAKTNVFVYMAERRCSFDIITVPLNGDDMILVKDPEDHQFEVNFK